MKCNICHSSICKSFPNKFFKNTLFRCQNCGLIFVYPQPTFSKIKEIYTQQYFQNRNSNSIGYENYPQDKLNIIKTFEKRFKKIEELYPKKGKILDLGCAMGFFLEVAENYGWTPYGVEISKYASDIAKKHFGDRIFNGTLDRTCFPNGSFDTVTMWDYLEHIPDPYKELSCLWKLLKNNGMLVISTPDANSFSHKIFKSRWMGYKDQEHLFYFSEKNIRILLEKVGFKVLKSEKVGKYISLDLFAKRLGLYNKFLANILKFLISKTNLQNLSFYINPLDIVCIYAKK